MQVIMRKLGALRVKQTLLSLFCDTGIDIILGLIYRFQGEIVH